MEGEPMVAGDLRRLRKLAGVSLHKASALAAAPGLLATRVCAYETGRIPLNQRQQLALRAALLIAGRERLRQLQQAIEIVELPDGNQGKRVQARRVAEERLT